MRFTRIGMLAAAFFLTTLAASAQLETTPQQWTIVTTKESAPNAYPLLDANGNPYSCNGQNVDNPKDSNSNCYNPLVITTDWTLTSEFGIADRTLNRSSRYVHELELLEFRRSCQCECHRLRHLRLLPGHLYRHPRQWRHNHIHR